MIDGDEEPVMSKDGLTEENPCYNGSRKGEEIRDLCVVLRRAMLLVVAWIEKRYM